MITHVESFQTKSPLVQPMQLHVQYSKELSRVAYDYMCSVIGSKFFIKLALDDAHDLSSEGSRTIL
jgi:hypothetical protein